MPPVVTDGSSWIFTLDILDSIQSLVFRKLTAELRNTLSFTLKEWKSSREERQRWSR